MFVYVLFSVKRCCLPIFDNVSSCNFKKTEDLFILS